MNHKYFRKKDFRMNATELYRETMVTTRNKGRLIIMLYEGAINFLKQAVIAIQARDYNKKGRLLAKAQDIILEMNLVLDTEAGGQLAINLRRLYNYMQNRLTVANNKCDSDILREVIALLEELNKGWTSIEV